MVNSRLCEAARPQFQNSRLSFLKKLRLQDTKSPENKTSKPITNTSKIWRSGQNFPRPTFFKEPFHTPWVVGKICPFDFFFWNINSQFSLCRLKSSTNWSVCWKIICYSKSKLSDIPYPRNKLFTKLFEDHTLDSGTYLYNLCYRSKLGLGDKELRINLG